MSMNPTIEIVLTEQGVHNVAMAMWSQGFTPVMVSAYVASKPFDFTDEIAPFSVRNLQTGEINESYSGNILEIVVHEGDFHYIMDNGDVLNISETMRQNAMATFQRFTEILAMRARLN